MSYCLNPVCPKPENPEGTKVCLACSAQLLLNDRYRAIQPIGHGGFGRTFMAVDEHRLQAKCAIKQFLPSPQIQGNSGAMAQAIRLFEQEARRLLELGEQHSQIPTLLAYFQQEKSLYLVQQFIEGQDLWQELETQGAFNEQQIREVLADLLPVLHFIHKHQVIHRDINPTNIMRRRSDRRLVLVDFGISKQLQGSQLSQRGTRAGTFGYSPLEQIRGGKAFPASDLYSLGVTCIQLLTDRDLEELFDPLAGRWMWREQLEKQNRKVSDRLAQILDKLTEDMVSDRYQSAEAVLADLNGTPAQILTPAAPSPLPSKPLSIPPQSAPPSRGWRCTHTLSRHSSWVTCVAVSPKSPILVSGSLDDSILVWNFHTGELLKSLSGHWKSINSLAISPDGELLASCSDDDTIKLWQLSTGTLLGTISGHIRDVNAVAYIPQISTHSAEEAILASGSEDKTIRLWSLSRDNQMNLKIAATRTLAGRSGMVKCLAIDPSGQFLVSAGLEKMIHVWKLATGELVGHLVGHLNSVNCLAISPKGQILASGSKDQTIKLWQLSTGKLITTISGHPGVVNGLAFSLQGATLFSASSDKTVKLWQVSTGKLMTTLSGHTGVVNCVAIAPDGKTLISGSWDKTLKVWQWHP